MAKESSSIPHNQPVSSFATFPEFSTLTIKHKEEFQTFVSPFPPIGDIQFATLLTWWDSLDGVQVAQLNGNLVVQYWRPGDEARSGLSLIGTQAVDETICTIFDYLRERNQPVRLVNVAEFVVSEVEYPAMFSFHEERAYHEYIIPVANFYPFKNITGYRNRKIQRLFKKYGKDNLVSKSLDLQKQANVDLLIEATDTWWKKNLNDFGSVGKETIKKSIRHANALGFENVCMFADDTLLGFCLYQQPSDKRYVICSHIKATQNDTLTFELIAYMLGQWFGNQGFTYGNLTEDWGRLRLRMFMLTLGPSNFFRKYTVEPAN